MKKNNRIFQLLKNNLISQKGMALLATLIFVFILTTFGIALLTMTRNDIKLSTLQEESTKAFYLADAGVERAINWLEKQGTPPSAEDIPPVNFDRNHIHEFDELKTGKYTVFLSIDNPASSVAGYIIETEGWITRADASRVSRKIKTMVTISNFAEYAYFSNQELFPNNSNISGSESYAGQTIWFIGDDIFGGKVHSNSQFHMVGEPNFYGKVTSTEDTIDFWGNAFAPDGNDFPGFHSDYVLGVDNIPLPLYRQISDLNDDKSLQRIAGGSWGKSDFPSSNNVYVPHAGGVGTEATTGGIYVKGDVTSINLDVDNAAEPNSQITFVQGGNTTTIITSVLSPITLPTGSTLNGVAAGGNTIPANTTLVKKPTGVNVYESYQGISNGLLFVDGSINGLNGNNQRGKMSIVSTESITITNDIYYYDRDKSKDLLADDIEGIEDSLGLIAAKDVKIASNIPRPDIEVDAIIMALNTSFFYAGWQSIKKGTLSLLGGLIQKERGPVGTHNAGVKVTGFSKNYQYDTRMANPAGGNLPPYFPSTGQYQKVYWKEVY